MVTPRSLTAAAAASAPPWDLVVIGAGSAGLVASRGAGGFGSRVLLIERHRFGGECLHTGCVPSKALLAAAHAAHDARASAHLGVTADVTVDFARVMRHVHDAVAAIEPADSPEAAHGDGVHTLAGDAQFTGPREVVVAGRTIRFRQAIVATGASPNVPDIDGIGAVDPLTVESFWSLTDQPEPPSVPEPPDQPDQPDQHRLPERLLIVGGGAVACELGQAMARLGSRVTIVQRAARIATRETDRVSGLLRRTLEADGVDVRTSVEVARFERADAAGTDAAFGPTHFTATLTDGTTVAFDRVLLALGTHANTAGLGLDAAGVETDETGRIMIDRSLRTSNPAIWAAGDVTTLPHFTHVAGVGGSTAGTNAILGLRRRVAASVPRVLYTQPEVAAIGVSPDEAQANGCHVLESSNEHLDRAIAEGRTAGFTQLVVDGRGALRGAVVVSPRAGETISELTVAMSAGVSVAELGGIMHAYPSYTDGVYNTALGELQREYSTGLLGRAVQVLRRARKAMLRAGE